MNIVDLINNFNTDPFFLIQMNTKDALKKDILILKPLKEKEYQYLNEIGDNTVIYLSDSRDSIRFIRELRNVKKNNKVILTITNKKNFNNELFSSNIDPKNVFVKVDVISSPISLKEYIYNEKVLYSMIDEAKDFSPLEKYLYAFDVVKKLKDYKEHKKDKLRSRNLYHILFNNYIVCTGFTTILSDLLDKLDVPSKELTVEIGMSGQKAIGQLKKKYDWDKLDYVEKHSLVKEQMNYIPQDFRNHSRLLVNIDDPKYGVNGIYISDVTFDNNLKKSLYNHALMTQEQSNSLINKNRLLNNHIELLYSSDIYEFYDKYNYLLKRNINDDLSKEEYTKELINNLLLTIKELDLEFYDSITNKYSFDINKEYEYSYLNNILNDLAVYIINKFNNKVNFSTIISAIKEIYKEVYQDGLSNNEIDTIIKDNEENHYFEHGTPIKH